MQIGWKKHRQAIVATPHNLGIRLPPTLAQEVCAETQLNAAAHFLLSK